jgi:uncharacterized membrane protein YphA (DoxX/SURF4 family)
MYLNLLAIGDGLLLVLGLWTPIAGFLVGILVLWSAVLGFASLCPAILLATMGSTMAFVGPGEWSLDAWLFGWKRIDIKD